MQQSRIGEIMHYIGLDVGGTNVRFSYKNSLEATALEYQKRPFVKTGNPYEEVNENICKIIDSISDNVKGIGISLAAVMDRSSGRVKTWSNNSCWDNYELVKHLKRKYNVPIVIEDDANCGAIGEYRCLNTFEKNMAYITIGTGIGCGLILNNSLFIGENGFAGEVGHIYLENVKNICNCGHQGCFQSIASGPAIINEYNAIAKEKLKSLEEMSLKNILHDPVVSQVFSHVTESISIVVYNLTMCLDISIFVIGGGVSNIGAKFISQIENKVNERLKKFERKISVHPAQLGEFSGVYGALLILDEYIMKD